MVSHVTWKPRETAMLLLSFVQQWFQSEIA